MPIEIKQLSLDLIDDPKIAMRTDIDDVELQELMASMKDVGLLQPIVVRPVADRFEIIAGHRRTQAARLLDWTHIEAKIMEASEDEVFALRLAENLQRKDTNPVDEACFIGEIMLKYRKTEDELAHLLKRSAKWVAERLEVFHMPDYMQQYLKEKRFALGAALWLGRIENEPTRRYYTNWAAINGVTVAQAERWYLNLKENAFVLEGARDIVVEVGTPREAIRQVVKCARCGVTLFLEDADNAFAHRICPNTEQKPNG